MNRIDIYFKSQITKFKETILKGFSDTYFKDNIIRYVLFFSGIVITVVWGLSIFYFKISNYMVPIKYNSFFGVTSLGSWYDLYRLPVFLTLITFLNIFLSKSIYKKEKIISYILTSTNIFLGLIVVVLIVNFGKLLGN